MKSRPGCRHHIPGSPFSTALWVLAQCSNLPHGARGPWSPGLEFMEAAGNGNLLILRCFLFLALWKKVHVLKGNLYAVASYKTLILPPPNPFAWEGFALLPAAAVCQVWRPCWGTKAREQTPCPLLVAKGRFG